MNREESLNHLLLNVCRGEETEEPLAPQFCNQLLQKLNTHRLSARAFFLLQSSLPSTAFAELEKAWKSSRERNSYFLTELDALSELSQQAGFKVTALKGAALLPSCYPDLGSRTLSNLDLLINEQDSQKVRSILAYLDYEISQEKRIENPQQKIVARKKDHIECCIEIRTQLFSSQPKTFQWLKTDRDNYQILEPTDQLLHLCGHYAYQHNYLLLFWLVDIYEYLSRYRDKIDWPAFFKRSQELGIYQACLSTLRIANHYLSAPLPDEFPRTKNSLREFLSWDYLVNSSAWPLHYFTIQHLKADTLVDSFKNDWIWLKSKLTRSGGPQA